MHGTWRAVALCCTAIAFATPATAAAMPLYPYGSQSDPPTPRSQTVVRTFSDDQTPALVLASSALLVALAGLGYAGRIGRRVTRLNP